MPVLKDCFKGYTWDLDKALPPEETVQRVLEAFNSTGRDILAGVERIDTQRLGIPVFVSLCGPEARKYLPGRKQMGKGSSTTQARASALMELVERYSFFTFWQDPKRWNRATWTESGKRHGQPLIPIERILQSVQDDLTPKQAVEVMDLVRWRFAPVENLSSGTVEHAPMDWFKTLNEFNGSSAGNTAEESILQGACELIERHVSALVDRECPALPTIDPASFSDPVLIDLVACFRRTNIRLLLKDFSLGMPAPTVAALAWDPATFPDHSEIVFTAGTAASPEKAAIRAVTEVAQLGGDFETGSNYEASGLRKFRSLEECAWLQSGDVVPVDSLPDIAHDNMRREIEALCKGLSVRGFTLYAADISHPELTIPAHFSFVPGFLFRERTAHASLGLFVGRRLSEESPPAEALAGLDTLDRHYPDNHFCDFFRGMVSLRQEDLDTAECLFAAAEGKQPSAEDRALAAFYRAYALTRREHWAAALPHLDRAIELSPDHHSYLNLRGAALYRQQRYAAAARDFQAALEQDRGSAMDLANLGLCYQALGKHRVALDHLENALKLDPDLEFARFRVEELRGLLSS